MTGLSLASVSVRYGSSLALDEVSLDVAEGEVVAVIGPSGSGKSTLLRAIAGLEPLASGSIIAGGRSLEGVATHRRDLGLMFQDHALFPHLTVADNVAFGLEMKGWAAAARRERVGELLAVVGLEGFGGRSIDQLSGGEAQRVALARALAPEPSLLMLDEPFGSIDRVLRDELTVELRRLLTDLGQTALHVTHDQGEAFTVADRIAVLRAGRLEQVGPPDELWRAPTSAFVAEFVGHPNIWPASAVGEGAGSDSVVVPIPALRLVEPDDGQVLRGVVEGCEFRDGRYRVRARLVGHGDAVIAVVDTDSAAEVGSEVAVSLDEGQVHRLDS